MTARRRPMSLRTFLRHLKATSVQVAWVIQKGPTGLDEQRKLRTSSRAQFSHCLCPITAVVKHAGGPSYDETAAWNAGRQHLRMPGDLLDRIIEAADWRPEDDRTPIDKSNHKARRLRDQLLRAVGKPAGL